MLVGIRYPRFMEYLEWLIAHELVAESLDDDKAKIIILTPKGIDSYHRLVDWIKEVTDVGKI